MAALHQTKLKIKGPARGEGNLVQDRKGAPKACQGARASGGETCSGLFATGTLSFRSELRRYICCIVEPMTHDIESDASQLLRGTAVSLDYEPYSLSPNAQHNLKVFTHKPKSTRSAKVLIVEDDPDLCLGLRIQLQAYYDTYIANDAGAGLSMAFAEMPDVIILDIGLPDYDGYFFMQSLSETPGLAGLPVIVLTARDRFTHEWRCHNAGAKRFFQKPIDNRSLLVAIEELVG